MELKKILWPTDLSENAAQALPLVTELADKCGAEVHVLYVLEELGHYGAWYGDFERASVAKLQETERLMAEGRLDEICSTALKDCRLYVRHIAVGDPAGEILKFIDRERPDLVVLSSLGRKGRFALGSVADRVLRNAPVPVVTVPVPAEK